MCRFLIAATFVAVTTNLAGADEQRKTVDAACEKALRELPGQTAFAFTEIGTSGPKLLFGVRDAEAFAVGSSFKLWILGTLIDEVNQGRRQMGNVMLLRPELVGPPSSELAGWPAGSPVTLHTLALKMISISDNTATDHLLYLLGRERVEAQMAAMGHSDPAVNRPLFSTRDMVALRDTKRGLPGREYKSLDEGARRTFLKNLTSGRPDYERLDFDTAAYGVAEWYASPLDMAHALAWIFEHTSADNPAHEVRAILAVDPKLSYDATIWPFVGFKGGSEDQLLAGNWLLQNKNGRWYTLHIFCNSPTQKVEPQQMISATEQIFKIVSAAVE